MGNSLLCFQQSVLHDMEMRNMKMAEQFKQIQKTQVKSPLFASKSSISVLSSISKSKNLISFLICNEIKIWIFFIVDNFKQIH